MKSHESESAPILVSIITPACNAAPFIQDTIDAIIAQTCQDWELLIADDASDDNTCDIVEEYVARDNRITLFRLQQRKGAAEARNHSIRHAKGRFIAFCDSDDVWTHDKLEKQIAFMLEHRYAFSFAPYYIMDRDGNHLGLFMPRSKVTYDDLLRTCDIGCLTVIYDAGLLGQVYMPLIRRRQDYALWLKLLKKVEAAYCYPEPLGSYRLHPNSISSNKIKAIYYIFGVYRHVEKLSWLKSCRMLIIYSLNGIRKYLPLFFRQLKNTACCR